MCGSSCGGIIAYEPKVAKAIARIPSGWHSCYSPLIKKYSSRMEIRVIRVIRVLLNIEILVFSVEYLWGGLYEYNYPSNKELSIFTGQFPLPKGKQKWYITTGSYACIAPVGGHTCITAGEQGEPAVVLYERINLSVFVPLFRGTSKEFAEGVSGGPTASGYATNCFKLSGCCGSSYGDR